MSPKRQKYKQIHAWSPTHGTPSGFELNPYLNSIFILPALLLAFQCQKTLLKAVNVAKFICGVEPHALYRNERDTILVFTFSLSTLHQCLRTHTSIFLLERSVIYSLFSLYSSLTYFL